ncbi:MULTISPECIES: hypothetical protein [unclassified Ensifer]|uniref:hypothetical protein n=1 Tax=unclassified Ensifer TaxID=2633371 RepID=UPI00300F9C80
MREIISADLRLVRATLAILALVCALSPAYAYSVYRPVTADGSTGVVIWTTSNFGVSGQPAALTFFHFPSDTAARQGMPFAQCFLKVDFLATNNPPVGARDEVGNLAVPVNADPYDQPRPFPWNIVFDNNPPGHWSIARYEISNAMINAAAGRVAAAGFRSLATTVGSNVTVVEGHLSRCSAQ